MLIVSRGVENSFAVFYGEKPAMTRKYDILQLPQCQVAIKGGEADDGPSAADSRLPGACCRSPSLTVGFGQKRVLQLCGSEAWAIEPSYPCNNHKCYRILLGAVPTFCSHVYYYDLMQSFYLGR